MGHEADRAITGPGIDAAILAGNDPIGMGGVRRARGLAALALAVLSGCSPTAILNGLAPRGSVRVVRGLAYAPGPRGAMDLYLPRAGRNWPLVVFFYGGGWTDGTRASYRFVGAALAARGVATLIPDYRVYPAVRFPAFVQDGAQAVAWAGSHAASFGADPTRLFLMGHSAGAEIATLLAYDPAYLCAAGAAPSRIAGVIGLAGPYDFLPLRTPELRAIFGPEADWPASQPIRFVTPDAPPSFLAAGTADHTVDPANTRRLAARLHAAGVAVETRFYAGRGHRLLIGGMAGLLAPLLPVRRDVLGFIAETGARRVATPHCLEFAR